MSFYQSKNRNHKLCDVSDDSSAYQKTTNGLSMTPAQIKECVARGIPVTTANVDMFVDGVSNPSTVLPIDELRGVDAVDAWNASMDAKKKIAKAHISDISKFGV